MLTKDIWLEHEPRFGFPLFKNVNTLVAFSIRSDFNPIDTLGIAKVTKSAIAIGLKKGISQAFRETLHTASEYSSLLLSSNSQRLQFRIIMTTRKGKFLGSYSIEGLYPPGGSIDIDFRNVLSKLGLPDDDYMAILVMSRGRADGFRSSPGSYSMTYFNDKAYATYRTGGFARVLNDPKRKQHYGFRGINPLVVVNNEMMSSLFLINHSSDPLYDTTVCPTSVLIRHDGKTREAVYGDIPPFGGIEKTMEELFGEDTVDFLAPFGGRGTVITTCPGVTLASLHLRRARDGSSMAIDHSRPSHTYLLHGGLS